MSNQNATVDLVQDNEVEGEETNTSEKVDLYGDVKATLDSVLEDKTENAISEGLAVESDDIVSDDEPLYSEAVEPNQQERKSKGYIAGLLSGLAIALVVAVISAVVGFSVLATQNSALEEKELALTNYALKSKEYEIKIVADQLAAITFRLVDLESKEKAFQELLSEKANLQSQNAEVRQNLKSLQLELNALERKRDMLSVTMTSNQSADVEESTTAKPTDTNEVVSSPSTGFFEDSKLKAFLLDLNLF